MIGASRNLVNRLVEFQNLLLFAFNKKETQESMVSVLGDERIQLGLCLPRRLQVVLWAWPIALIHIHGDHARELIT